MNDTIAPPQSPLRARAVRFSDSAIVQNFILFVILFNAVILGLETSDAVMETAGPLILILDKICLGIFVAEIAVKLYGRGLEFFRRGWSIFDFVIVGISLIPATQGLSVLRALRILRLLRVVSVAPQPAPAHMRHGQGARRLQPGHGAGDEAQQIDALALLAGFEQQLLAQADAQQGDPRLGRRKGQRPSPSQQWAWPAGGNPEGSIQR